MNNEYNILNIILKPVHRGHRSFVRFNTLPKQRGRVQRSQGPDRKKRLEPEVKANHRGGREETLHVEHRWKGVRNETLQRSNSLRRS